MQKIFSVNQGTKLLDSKFVGALKEQKDLRGRVGVGTWYTSAEFDNVKVTDNKTGEILGSDDFKSDKFWWNWEKATDGEFKVKDGKLVQGTTDMEYSLNGSVAYFGDADWTDYTYTLTAKKLDGQEGFIIPVAVDDKNNNYF